MKFQLFRIKVYLPRQADIFFGPEFLTRGSILSHLLLSTPTKELRKGHIWHVGNVEKIEGAVILFAFGRVTKQTLAFWDDAKAEFHVEEAEGAPFTYILVDTEMGICAIAVNAELAPNAHSIARRLQKLLGKASATEFPKIEFDIAPIFDPRSFLESLRAAYSITSFTAEFTRPNPIDANEDFQRPLERFASEVDGTHIKATVSGSSLRESVLEEVTRSAAASGNDVSARMRASKDARPVTKHLRGNAMVIEVDSLQSTESKKEFSKAVRDYYIRDVRKSLSDGLDQ